LLADVRQPAHREQLRERGIAPFELLVSNLYPFEETAASGAPAEECVEQIDIGGPAMVRAAAKNHASVAVITDPSMYPEVAEAVTSGGFTLAGGPRLPARAFAHPARADAPVAPRVASGYAPGHTPPHTSRPVDLAAQIADIFTEVVVAPGFEPAARELLTAKKNLRLLACPPPGRPAARTEWRQLDGGLLMQSADLLDAPGDDPASWELKAGRPASPEAMADLAFAWRACRSVKSNAILIAIDGATVGVGMGQVNRVDAARLAVTRSKERAIGAVAASDAFFPFADGLKVLAGAGVRAIVEPGGSVRDDEVVTAAENEGVTLYFTGARHFFH